LIEKFVYIDFDKMCDHENKTQESKNDLDDDCVENLEGSSNLEETRPLNMMKQNVDTSQGSTKELAKEWRTSRDLSLDNIISDINKG